MHPSFPTLSLVLLTAAAAAPGQAPSTIPPSLAASAQALTPSEQQDFAAARTAGAQQHWAEAAARFRALHAQLPANTTLSKYTADADVQVGQDTEAVTLLQPVLAADADDVQALAIAAHAYADLHQSAARDAMLAKLQALADAGKTTLPQVQLQRENLIGGNSLQFIYYPKPWGHYNISLMARLYDGAGKLLERITLESADFDQPAFAKAHPAEAANGKRAYSIDGYADHPDPQGGGTQTHFTYALLNDRPSLDEFIQGALAIANGKASPVSSRSGLPMPSAH